jgi:hypothetical protein
MRTESKEEIQGQITRLGFKDRRQEWDPRTEGNVGSKDRKQGWDPLTEQARSGIQGQKAKMRSNETESKDGIKDRKEGWDPIQGQKARMGSTDRARIGIQGQKAKVGSKDRM